ncbi:MAG: arginine--tRNA ligase [Sutterella sp.]|nr:arginine--tRNA ligase [Sutterella sp.]MDD7427893.1 arginine--tRNA ligase [Sutterella sp.]MDY3272927.1 arginine--tRNA ligase [Duodenibacillus sp.]
MIENENLVRFISRALDSIGITNVPVRIEKPKDLSHGDLACTVAMQCARALKRNPREIAASLVEAMKKDPEFTRLLSDVQIAGPGFINFRLNAGSKFAVIADILTKKDAYGSSDACRGKRVLLEYVSANPTGPLHLGHARQGALGDVLSRIMATQGYGVTREFYYNDAGVQIDNLTLSVQARAKELQGLAKPEDFPENGYHGDYIFEIARDYLKGMRITAPDQTVIESTGDINDTQAVRRYAVAFLRNEQDADLKALGVAFDNFYLESSLYTEGRVERAVKAIIDSGYTYEADGALWLKTTDPAFADFHDDKDRVMRKKDGHYTYFVPDVAYHLTKFERGFDRAINIQGSDHHGTVARVKIGLQVAGPAFGMAIPKTFPEYVLHKMLLVVKDGQEVKMSKRAGTYVTLRDIVDWVGRDAARFFLVSRKSDAEFVFDVDLALSKSEENPVYYLQYAHARICSVLAQAKEKGFAVPTFEEASGADFSVLQSDAAGALAQCLSAYGKTLSIAARDLAPHLVCVYLKELAASFHAFYNAERILVDDARERNARLALLLASRQVLANGLAVLGISAPEHM